RPIPTTARPCVVGRSIGASRMCRRPSMSGLGSRSLPPAPGSAVPRSREKQKSPDLGRSGEDMGNQPKRSGKIRVGIIGAGWWATAGYLPLLAADSRVEIAAVNRLGRTELERVQREFGACAAFEDYREMLASVELDAVLVTSPHTLHFEHAAAAFR